MLPDFSLEHEHNGPVCGIDEVGRGPLAGPVVAACVIVPDDSLPFLDHVKDSKKLTVKRKDELFIQIREYCSFGIAKASEEEIDTLNIHHATLLAMRRAYHDMLERFDTIPKAALIDGKFIPEISCPAQAVIKGDSLSKSIAAASILAKVTRDRIMAELHREYPAYGWERNAGYSTKEHLQAINDNGITKYHRRTFGPCKNRDLY